MTSGVRVVDFAMLGEDNFALPRACRVGAPDTPGPVGDTAVHGFADDLGHEQTRGGLGVPRECHPVIETLVVGGLGHVLDALERREASVELGVIGEGLIGGQFKEDRGKAVHLGIV